MGTPRLLKNRYRLGKVIGRGGMGVVWLATDEVLDRPVAVKEVVFPPGLPGEEQETLRRRTLREARTNARLNHPNVVGVYDIVDEADRPWIVMEFVPSRSLAETVRADGPLSPPRTAGIGLQLLRGLRAAHAAGVLHRDVKPSNVLLADDGRVVLGDFGIATAKGGSTITSSGVLIGSPSYMAPERARGRDVGPESDLWSLGATLYTAVEGRPPFDRDSAVATLAALVMDDPDPPRHAGPLWPLIAGLLHRDPAQRPSADAVATSLREIAEPPGGRVPGAEPLSVPRPRVPLDEEPPLPEPEPELQPEPQPGPESESESGPESEPEYGERRSTGVGLPESEPEPEPESQPQPQPEPQHGERRSADAGPAEPEPGGGEAAGPPEDDGEGPETAATPPADSDAAKDSTGARPASGLQTKAADPKPGAATEPDTSARTGPGTGSRTGSGTGSRTGSGTGPRTGAGTGSRTGSDTGPRTGSDTGSRIGADAGPRTGPASAPRAGQEAGPAGDRAIPSAGAASSWTGTGTLRASTRPRRRRLLAVVAATVAVVVVALLTWAIVVLPGGGHKSHQTAGGAPGRGTSRSPATPSRSAPSPAATSSSAAPPASPTTGALPDGYHWHHDGTGFSIAVPDGWSATHHGHYLYVEDPKSSRILIVDQTDTPKSDPLADWRRQEAARRGGYPGYHRIRLERVDYPQARKAADWEFTYNGSGGRDHVLNRNILVNDEHAYALYWSTPEDRWKAGRGIFDAFASSFRPATG